MKHLELLSKYPAHPVGRPPIVLVHGAWHGAWCWEGNFLEYFADRGWETHALSLRGHGASAGADGVRWWSIADYVADVEHVVSGLERPPILVGHSMGGLVVQKFLESHPGDAAGAVLLASVPPSGSWRFFLRLLRRHPLVWLAANLLMDIYLVVSNPRHAREWLFSPGYPDDLLMKFHPRLQSESFRAALDMLLFDLPQPSRVKARVAVIGGDGDQIFTVPEVMATAQAYGVKPKIFPDMAHNLMSERGWEGVADWILDWSGSLPRG